MFFFTVNKYIKIYLYQFQNILKMIIKLPFISSVSNLKYGKDNKVNEYQLKFVVSRCNPFGLEIRPELEYFAHFLDVFLKSFFMAKHQLSGAQRSFQQLHRMFDW